MMTPSLSILSDLLSIPSVSTDPEFASGMEDARSYLLTLFTSLGFTAHLLPGRLHPAVFASYIVNPSHPTVLIYGHYDVQPAGAPSQWTTPAFEPSIRKNRIYARGATDNKGQFMIHVMAVRKMLESDALPINVKFLIEGEEEIGSPGIEFLTENYKTLLSADYLFLSDTEMPALGQPAIDITLRGCLDVEIHIQTSAQDLHSGQFGGVAPNPAQILAKFLSRLKNGSNKITLPGFYTDVISPNDEEIRDFRKTEPSDTQLLKEGHYFFVGGGENRYSLNRRRWFEPTLDITGLDSGYTGIGTKSIIPDTASAKISIRFVPDQDPEQIYSSLASSLHHSLPKATVWRLIRYPVASAFKAPTDHPVFELVKSSLKSVFGRPAVFQGQGGSIGSVPVLVRALGLPAVMIGFGLPDENLHSPNEHFSLENYFKGIETMSRIYSALPVLHLPNRPESIPIILETSSPGLL